MAINNQKIIIDGFEYEYVSAEVIEVDYFGNNTEKLYSVSCRILNPFGSQATGDIINARPMDSNLKNLPITGEVVLITKGPTAYNSAGRSGREYYYSNPIAIQSSIHHNGIPGVTTLLNNAKSTNNSDARQSAKDGVWNKVENRLTVKETIDPRFGERLDVYPIQPYPGDVILEGRFGNSIRLGSTIDDRRNYPVKPAWKAGLGAVGNPILIISNGTNPTEKPFNSFVQEEIDKDDSTIWMTSGQTVKFTPASTFVPSIQNRNVDLHNKNNFSGNQILISSDRIILNSKKQETSLFSAEGIGLSSMKGIAIDSKDVVELESSRINIGVNAVHPVLLGDVTMNWLAELCDLVYSALGHIAQQTHTSNTGPTGPPINAGAFTSLQGKIKSLRSKIKKLPSDLVFVNEKAGGPKSDAAAEAKEKNKNGEGYVNPMPSEADLMSTADVIPQSQKPVAESTNVVTLASQIDEIEKQKEKILQELENDSLSIGKKIDTNEVGYADSTSQEFQTGNETLNSIIPNTKNTKYANGITFAQLGITDINNVNIDGEGFFNYEGDINLTNVDIPGVGKLTEIPIKFGSVNNFVCSAMGLTSLNNAPYETNTFDASANNLKTLEGGPETAVRYKVDYCGLTSLEGGPVIVSEEFSAEGNNLKNLVGGPKNGPKMYRVDGNKSLLTLRGLPAGKPIQILYASGCNLTSVFLKKDTPSLLITKSVYLDNQVSSKQLVTDDLEKWIKQNWDGSSDKSLRVFPEGSLKK